MEVFDLMGIRLFVRKKLQNGLEKGGGGLGCKDW